MASYFLFIGGKNMTGSRGGWYLARTGILCLFAGFVITGCLARPDMVSLEPRCPSIPATVFERIGVDAQLGASYFVQVATADVDLQKHPDLLTIVNQTVREEQVTASLICAAGKRGELTTPQQVAHAWNVARFYRTNPTAEEAMQFNRENPFPRKTTSIESLEQPSPCDTQGPLPKAEPNRFAVAVACVENDKTQEDQKIILEALEGLENVQILRFARIIAPTAAQPEDRMRVGHESARHYLRESGADVLIWGTMLRRDGQSLPKLFWTMSKDGTTSKQSGRYQPTDDGNLPQIVWADLADVLHLLVMTQDAEFTAQAGRFTDDRLLPFIPKTRRLLSRSPGQPGWSPDSLTEVRAILAVSLRTYGEQARDNASLQEAVMLDREVLKERTRERVPLDWAATQNNLGHALWKLGEREAGTVRLEEAVVAYQEALKEWTQKRVPLKWAMTQNNLGLTHQALERKKRPK